MDNTSHVKLREELRTGLAKAGYRLAEDGTYRLSQAAEGQYHTAHLEGTHNTTLVVRADFSSTRFLRSFNIFGEASLHNALDQLGKTIRPSYIEH